MARLARGKSIESDPIDPARGKSIESDPIDPQSYLQERARSKGVEVSHLVNEMLRQDIKLIEAVK